MRQDQSGQLGREVCEGGLRHEQAFREEKQTRYFESQWDKSPIQSVHPTWPILKFAVLKGLLNIHPYKLPSSLELSRLSLCIWPHEVEHINDTQIPFPTVHSYKVYNRMAFRMFPELWGHHSQLENMFITSKSRLVWCVINRKSTPKAALLYRRWGLLQWSFKLVLELLLYW